jgi:membrane protein DedA with SNARE-associated domain
MTMDALQLLFEQYGLALVFGAVLLEQVGPPIPSGPLLIVAGALSFEGRVSLLAVSGVAWAASMIGKIALFALGRHYGRRTMQTLCRFAVTPNANIGKADRHFERWGATLLIVAEFLPGIRTLAPSLAGIERLRPGRFLIYSAIGAALWTAVYVGIGRLFHEQIGGVLALVEQFGKVAIGVILGVAVLYFAVRWWRRHRSAKGSEAQTNAP